ncbi:MAG: ParB/RepB/Spo0J family partition protein [Pyrinomonadaceae bacterium]
MTRKALGRGLGALLSAEQRSSAGAEEPYEIEINLIEPGPMQPRTRFDQTKLEALSKSITENGVVQPVLVRRQGTRYELIAGERRWRAAQLAGLTRIPAVVREVADDKVLELALVENLQREDLDPIEEAQAYKKLVETIGLTQESIAERVGRDRSYITNYLRLLRLPLDIQTLVRDGKLSTGHGRTLLGIRDIDEQRQLSKKIIQSNLSVRATERLVKHLAGTTRVSRKARVRPTVDPNIRSAETRLRRELGTKVRIFEQEGSASGRIEIEFYSLSDLERIYRLLAPAANSPGT